MQRGQDFLWIVPGTSDTQQVRAYQTKGGQTHLSEFYHLSVKVAYIIPNYSAKGIRHNFHF